MMKNSVLFIVACLLVCSTSSFAKKHMDMDEPKDETAIESVSAVGVNMESFSSEQATEKKKSASSLKNTVKLNLTSLLFKTVSLQYERELLPKMSVAVGLRMTPTSRPPFLHTLINEIEHQSGEKMDEDVMDFVNSTRIGGWSITPEFRYYLGKKHQRGLYLAPFLRYGQLNVRSTFVLIDDEDDSRTVIPFDAKASAFGAGILLGWQFRLHERITLDWWIIGPYYTANTVKLSASGLDLDPDVQQDLRDMTDDVDVGNWLRVSTDITATSAHVNLKANAGAIRGFGLCIGVRL